MGLEKYGITVPDGMFNRFLTECVGRVFKILPIYEECSAKNEFQDYNSYVEKVVTTFTGSKILFEQSSFLTLTSTLAGLLETENLNQKKVRSIVFHCISLIEKMRKE